MPLPNYFLGNTTGPAADGLNIAGYAWQQPVATHVDTYEGRVDHNFSDNERLQVSYNHVHFNTQLPGALPTSPIGQAPTNSLLATVVLNSILRPNLLNAVRVGIVRPSIEVISGYHPRTGGDSALYHQGSNPYLISPLTFSPVVPIDSALDGYKNVTPNYQYGDTVTWLKGKHSFKGGVEARLISYAGYDIANASLNSMLEVRYVGTKGTKLIRGTNVNETNVFENGILAGFNAVKSGGSSPLIDQIFNRYAPAGTTGSQFVLTSPFTQAFFANNNVGAFANFINNSTSLTPGVPGGPMLNAGLPQNFVTVSPQYATEYLLGNNSASTYNALQVEFRKQFSTGLTLQGNFTWNRYLGNYNAGDDSPLQTSFRTLRNEQLDKQLLDRKFFWRSNGLWELPFGPGKLVGHNSHGFLTQAIGGWQVGVIFNVFSGYPITLYQSNSTFNTVVANSLPNISGAIPSGSVTRVGSGVQFFNNLVQTTDPQVATLASAVRGLSTMRAITDSSGNVIFSNSLPGQIGNLAPGALLGPGYFQFDMNIVKKFRVTEKIGLNRGANAVNILNTPQFANPTGVTATVNNLSIDNPTFGRITTTVYSNRIVVLTGRITF